MSPNQLFSSIAKYSTFHTWFLELYELFNSTGVDNLLAMKRKYIMFLGSQRYCKERRAEAIMSVVGVKTWFKAESQTSREVEQNLVLKQYPLAFVREVAAVLGATFFDSLSISPLGVAEVAERPPSTYLMPFNSGLGNSTILEQKVILNRGFGEEEEHPSVATWTITSEGSVQMSKAGIVASSIDETASEEIMRGIWLIHDAEDYFDPRFNALPESDQRFRTVELRTWLKSYNVAQGPNYAVELFYGREAKRGILLKEIGIDSGRLFNIGNFVTSRHYRSRREHILMAETVTVDWLVL